MSDSTSSPISINIEEIYRQEKQRWLKTEAPRPSFMDRLGNSVPYWLIIIAAVFFLLSAPHTAGTFHKITPWLGLVAPLGVEFGLLYTAFRRKQAHQRKQGIPRWLWGFEILCIIVAISVNGAGAVTSVIENTGLSNLSGEAVKNQFAGFPLPTQVSLLMALLSALIIPAGAIVAGEGLATLMLERDQTGTFYDAKWREVETVILYRAMFGRYVQTGLLPKDARDRAQAEVKGYFGIGAVQSRAVVFAAVQTPHTVQALPAPHTVRPNTAQAEQTAQVPNTSSGKKAEILSFVQANPSAAQLSINALMVQLRTVGIVAGRTTVAEVLREIKQEVQS